MYLLNHLPMEESLALIHNLFKDDKYFVLFFIIIIKVRLYEIYCLMLGWSTQTIAGIPGDSNIIW